MDYTDLYEFLNDTGIVVPNDKSVLAGIQTKFQEIFGTEIDLSAETPVGRLIEAYSVLVKTTLGITAQTANQFNIDEATGIYLDSIAQMYGLKRIAATKTRIDIKCYFRDATTNKDTIPAGAMVMNANGDLFQIDSPIPNLGMIDKDGRCYGVGTATAVTAGTVVAPPGSVTSIQTNVFGWVGVTNIGTPYTGSDLESDEAFRRRIKHSRDSGTGFFNSTTSALSRINGVYSSCILENNTGSKIVKKGIVIPPHSVFIGVDCIESDEILDEIAASISRTKPVGTGLVDSIDGITGLIQREVDYGYHNSQSQTISFYRATKTAIYVKLSYSLGNYKGDNVVEDITRVITEYVGSIGMGETVHGTMIANSIVSRLDVGIGSIQVQKEGSNSLADMTVEMLGYEVPYVLDANITLTETDRT